MPLCCAPPRAPRLLGWHRFPPPHLSAHLVCLPLQVMRGKDGKTSTAWSLRAAQEILQVWPACLPACLPGQHATCQPAPRARCLVASLAPPCSLGPLFPNPHSTHTTTNNAAFKHQKKILTPLCLTCPLRSRLTPSWTWAPTQTCCQSCCTPAAPGSGTTPTASPCCCGTRWAGWVAAVVWRVGACGGATG